MFDYCLYLQPHSFKDQSFKEAEWDERDKPAPEKIIRKAIKDGLPEPMQHKLADKDTDYRLMTEEKFNDTLTTIELKDERDRATYKETQDEVKCAQAKLRETSEPRNGINANSASRRATIPTVEELHVSAPYARMLECLRISTCPTRTPTARTQKKGLEEPWVVAWPTRISKYASTGKSQMLSSRSSARCRARTRSS